MIKLPILFYASKAIIPQDDELYRILGKEGVIKHVTKPVTFLHIDYFYETNEVDDILGRKAVIVASGGQEFTTTLELEELENEIRKYRKGTKNSGIFTFFTKRN